jgi:hypothetical protein
VANQNGPPCQFKSTVNKDSDWLPGLSIQNKGKHYKAVACIDSGAISAAVYGR